VGLPISGHGLSSDLIFKSKCTTADVRRPLLAEGSSSEVQVQGHKAESASRRVRSKEDAREERDRDESPHTTELYAPLFTGIPVDPAHS
jgi:hypothetical protein